MPPKRATRTSSRPSAGQGTLTFGNRVTKPATSPRGKTAKKEQALPQAEHEADSPATEVAIVQPPPANDPLTEPPSSTAAVLGGISGAPSVEEVDESEAADDATVLALSVAQIKSYWRAKEDARKAPRVHQSELTLAEKILREWDMSGQFGPCIGISRLRRWRRAQKLGLSPPVEVLAVLLGRLDVAEEGSNKGKGKGAARKVGVVGEGVEQKAYVDVLMGNRIAVGAA